MRHTNLDLRSVWDDGFARSCFSAVDVMSSATEDELGDARLRHWENLTDDNAFFPEFLQG